MAFLGVVLESVNIIGLQRRGFTEEQINEIKNIYRLVFHSDMIVSEAIEREAEISRSMKSHSPLR
ncbi:MAG: hypothetical protein ACFN23_06250 [Capnocytophaga gingivalis]